MRREKVQLPDHQIEWKGDMPMPANYCMRCGATLEAGAVFCRMCGAPLGGVPVFAANPECPVCPPPLKKSRSYVFPILALGCAVFVISFIAVMLYFGFKGATISRGRNGSAVSGGLMQRLVNKDVSKATDEFFSYLVKGDYKDAYMMLDGEAQTALKFDTFEAMMKGIGDKLGGRGNSSLVHFVVNDFTAGGKSGRLYVLTYQTKFEKGSALEEITVVKKDNLPYVHNYSIKSDKIPMFYFRPRGPGQDKQSPDEDGQDQQDRQDQQPQQPAVPGKPSVNI